MFKRVNKKPIFFKKGVGVGGGGGMERMSIKKVKNYFKKVHSHRWAAVGSDVEAQHLVNVIPSKVDQ